MMWGKEAVAKMKKCGERKKWGNGWQRVIGEILLLYGRIFDVHWNDIAYAILSEGNNNKASE